MSVLEAAAAGLPTVATDGSGTRETIQIDETGLLVPVGDAAALARAMTKIGKGHAARATPQNGRQCTPVCRRTVLFARHCCTMGTILSSDVRSSFPWFSLW